MNHLCRTMAATLVAAVIIGSLFSAAAIAAPNPPVELSLDEAIQRALLNNPAVTMSAADREAAIGALKSARAGFGPTVSLNHADTYFWAANPSVSILDSTKRLDRFTADNYISANWMLFSGFKVEGQVAQAKWGVDSANWGVTKTDQELRLSTTTAYYGILQAQKLVQLNLESVDQLDQHLKDAQLQFDVGVVAKTDVLRSEVEMANAVQNLTKAQNAYDLAMTTLDTVIGLPLITVVVPKENLKYEPYGSSVSECISTAMKLRPETFQGTDSVKIAEAGVTVARSGNLPTVTTAYRADWNDAAFPGITNTNQNWSIGIAANWTIFDSGLTSGNLKQANAGVTKAKAQLKQTSDNIRMEVQSFYLNLREAEKRIETSKVAVDKAQEDFKISQMRYSAGVGTNIDVLDAHVALTQANNNFAQALYDYNTSKASLESSMGLPVNEVKGK